MAVPWDLDLQEGTVRPFQLEPHHRPSRRRVPQRGPESAPGLVGALDVEVVGPSEALGGPLLRVRVLRVVEGEGTEVISVSSLAAPCRERSSWSAIADTRSWRSTLLDDST